MRKQFVHPVFKAARQALLIFTGGGGNETWLKNGLVIPCRFLWMSRVVAGGVSASHQGSEC